MAIQLKPPLAIPSGIWHTVFLGGSIEMGDAPMWQPTVAEWLLAAGWNVLNPRRDDWNSSWTQSADNPEFANQVNWELSALERANFSLMYFAPGTKSPISLLEMGLFGRQKRMFVVCPDGFYRKGNVDIVCRRYKIEQFGTMKRALQALPPRVGIIPPPVDTFTF